jgi:hypothetical protein
VKRWLEDLWLRFRLWRFRNDPVEPIHQGKVVVLTFSPSAERHNQDSERDK